MKIPNFDKAVIPPEKIEAYLLNPDHPDGGSKARFFLRVGFDPQTLQIALLKHIAGYEFTFSEATAYGTKYTVKGHIESPSGFSFNLRSIWIILNTDHSPKLITAYPSLK